MSDDDRMNRRTAPVAPEVAPTLPSGEESGEAATRSVFDRPKQRFAERGELGRGGMGRVAEAFDRALERTVAIKHSLATDPHAIARFEREIRITARLQHPNIVPILEAAIDDDGRPYCVMRKVDGEPLSKRVEQTRDVHDRLAFVPAILGAADAAAYAHAQNIIHRDIKPWNILLGPFGETLLIDWGLARELGEADAMSESPPDAAGLTRRGAAYGTPGYMAPEQARGEPADRRADVYSLGATLYFVLAQEAPYGRAGVDTTIAAAASGTPPDLARLPAQVPRELVAIAGKALAADPDRRYPSAGELAADLRRFLAGQLVAAHDYSVLERIARWLRRHRLVAAIAAIAIAAITVVSTISIRRVIAERDDADQARRLAEHRAEEMLVDRARTMVGVDPTSAVALLRGLPATSPMWPTARELVRAAVARGVERGLTPHARTIRVAALSRDGRLATASLDGTVQVHDLTGHTSRVVAKLQAIDLGWFDARTLAYMTEGQRSATTGANGRVVERVTSPEVGAIDVASGAHHAIDVGTFTALNVFDGHIVVLGADGSVAQFAADGRRDVIEPAGVIAFGVRSGRLALLRADRAIAIDPDRTRRERAVDVHGEVFALRIAPDGQRIAIVGEGEIAEWTMTGDTPPRRWARDNKALDARPRVVGNRVIQTYDANASAVHDVDYVGSVLHGWSTDGTRVIAFDGDVPSVRWTTVGAPLRIMPAGDGALLATREGRIAVATRFGVVEIAHRAVDLSFTLADEAGRRGVLCTATDELLVLDLDAALPRVQPLPAQTALHAIRDDRVVIGTRGRFAMLDLATGARVELGETGIDPHADLLPTRVVTGMHDRGEVWTVWDLAGRELLRIRTDAATLGPGLAAATSLFYLGPSGDVIEQPVEPPGETRTVGRIVTSRGPVVMLKATERGLAIIDLASATRRVTWIDRDGQVDRDLALASMVSAAMRTADHAWWATMDFESLWRAFGDGPAARVELPVPVRDLRLVDDEIWAIGSDTMIRLGLDARVRGTTALPGRIRRVAIDRGFAIATIAGPQVVMPLVDARRSLMLGTTPASIAASPDGRAVAALIPLGSEVAIARWRDPVPIDPAAVPAFLDAISNARLGFGSDAIVWDPPR